MFNEFRVVTNTEYLEDGTVETTLGRKHVSELHTRMIIDDFPDKTIVAVEFRLLDSHKIIKRDVHVTLKEGAAIGADQAALN